MNRMLLKSELIILGRQSGYSLYKINMSIVWLKIINRRITNGVRSLDVDQ